MYTTCAEMILTGVANVTAREHLPKYQSKGINVNSKECLLIKLHCSFQDLRSHVSTGTNLRERERVIGRVVMATLIAHAVKATHDIQRILHLFQKIKKKSWSQIGDHA